MLAFKYISVFFGALLLMVTEAVEEISENSAGSMEVLDGPELDNLDLSRKELRNLTRKASPEEFGKYVYFKYFKNGQMTYIGTGVNSESLAQTGCTPGERFAFILHGWRQTCETEWVPMLVAKLAANRGGCIICVDYGSFAQDTYVRLLRKFDALTDIVSDKMKHLMKYGMDPQETFIFGFSFGGQLATAIGRTVGPGLIKEIDTCDMAGPGFDYKVSQIDHRTAAQNVQCIHTSRDRGTRYYNCHQNWRMGNCGYNQIAAAEPPRGSHGLCPYFYVSAFEHDFFATKMPPRCSSKRHALFWPQNFKMGYMEQRKQLVSGELYAHTSLNYPYNVLPHTIGPLEEVPTVVYEPQYVKGKPVLNSIIRARKLMKKRRRLF